MRNPGWGVVKVCGGSGPRVYGYPVDAVILADSDTSTPGFQVELDEGENRLLIHVYKHGSVCDEDIEENYSLTLTRGTPAEQPENSRPVGLPSINGTAQVEETLIASTSNITDADGLENATFTYQWLSSRDTVIVGATGATYTLVDSDEGKTIKVRVSFTDDRGNQETLTSAATGAVAAKPTAPPPVHRRSVVRPKLDRHSLQSHRAFQTATGLPTLSSPTNGSPTTELVTTPSREQLPQRMPFGLATPVKASRFE